MRALSLVLAVLVAAGPALGAGVVAPRAERIPVVELPAAAVPLQAEAAGAQPLAEPLPAAPALERAAPFAGLTRMEKTIRWGGAVLGVAGLAAAAFDGSAWPLAAGAIGGAATALIPPIEGEHRLPYEERQRLAWRVHERLERLLPASGLPSGTSPAVEIVPAAHPYRLGVGQSKIAASDGWADAPDAELDSALAHELGHLYFNDLSDGVMAWTHLGGPALLWAGYAAFAALPFVAHGPWAWAGAVAAIAGGLATYGSVRLRERRADLYSALLAHPSGLIAALKRWAAVGIRADSTRWWIFGRKHPAPSKRIAYLRSLL